MGLFLLNDARSNIRPPAQPEFATQKND